MVLGSEVRSRLNVMEAGCSGKVERVGYFVHFDRWIVGERLLLAMLVRAW